MSNAKRWLIFGVTALSLVAIDQITKRWAVNTLGAHDTIDLFWTLRFRYIENFGVSFGMGQRFGRLVGFIVIGVVAAVIRFANRVHSTPILVLLALLTGGALGNLIDRIVRAEKGFMSGGVVDFIDFQWFPIFNVADMAVVSSALTLAVISFFDETLGTLTPLTSTQSENRNETDSTSNTDSGERDADV